MGGHNHHKESFMKSNYQANDSFKKMKSTISGNQNISRITDRNKPVFDEPSIISSVIDRKSDGYDIGEDERLVEQEILA